EDGNALFRWYRRVEGSFGHHGVARRAMFFGEQLRRRLGRTDRAAARLLDNGDRRGGEWWLRTWGRPGLACGRHVPAPDQTGQAATVRQGQRDSGQERSA